MTLARFALAGGLALLLVLAVLVARAGRAPHRVELTVAAPPERVFRFLTEPEKIASWMAGFVSSEPLTPGGLRLGARSRETLDDAGRRVRMTSEVTGLEPAVRLELRLEADFLDATSCYTLARSAGGTRLVHELVPRYKGPLRLVAPLMRAAVQRKLEADLGRLAARVAAPDEPPAS